MFWPCFLLVHKTFCHSHLNLNGCLVHPAGVVAEVVAHMIQLSLESPPLSSTSQHGEEELVSSRDSQAAEGHEADVEGSEEGKCFFFTCTSADLHATCVS